MGLVVFGPLGGREGGGRFGNGQSRTSSTLGPGSEQPYAAESSCRETARKRPTKKKAHKLET